MRKMITSKKEQQLLDMTEEVFESGTAVIPIGTSSINIDLLSLKPGYQYKIYTNLNATGVPEILRFETEIGVSQSYIDFIGNGKFLQFPLTPTSIAGLTNFRLNLTYASNELTTSLRCNGTSTSVVSWRYLITRSKLYF